MLKKTIILFVLLVAGALVTSAQTKFGYISYSSIVKALPEYAQTKQQLDVLKSKYDNEIKRSESEFNAKYADFLQGQKDFPHNILMKRQKELQLLMDQSLAYRKEVENILTEAEKKMLAPLLYKVKTAIKHISVVEKLAYVINIDNDNLLYVDEQQGEDLTTKVLIVLGVMAVPEQPTDSVTTTKEVVTPVAEKSNNETSTDTLTVTTK